jgi:hypothetical protein
MIMNYPQEAWHVEKIREFASKFCRYMVWNKYGSNRARIMVKIRVSDLLEIPISHVLCENTNDEGHGHSWTCVICVLQAKLIGGLGGDEDPLPTEGGNPHAMPNLPFGGVWEDVADGIFAKHKNIAPNAHHVASNEANVAPAAQGKPMLHTPPQSPPGHHNNAHGIQPVIDDTDAFTAIHKMMTDIMQNLPNVISKLDLIM